MFAALSWLHCRECRFNGYNTYYLLWVLCLYGWSKTIRVSCYQAELASYLWMGLGLLYRLKSKSVNASTKASTHKHWALLSKLGHMDCIRGSDSYREGRLSTLHPTVFCLFNITWKRQQEARRTETHLVTRDQDPGRFLLLVPFLFTTRALNYLRRLAGI